MFDYLRAPQLLTKNIGCVARNAPASAALT